MMRLLLQVVITTATFGDSPAPTPEPQLPAPPPTKPPPLYSPDLAATYTMLHLKPRITAPPPPYVPAVSIPHYELAASMPAAAARIVLPRPPDPPPRPAVIPTPTPALAAAPAAAPAPVPAPPPTPLVFGPTATMNSVALGLKNSPLASAPAWSLKHDGTNTVVAALPAAVAVASPPSSVTGTNPLAKSADPYSAHFQGMSRWSPGQTYRVTRPGTPTALTTFPHCHVIFSPTFPSPTSKEEHHCNGPVDP